MSKSPNKSNEQLIAELNALRKAYELEQKKRLETTQKLEKIQQKLSVFESLDSINNPPNVSEIEKVVQQSTLLTNIINHTSEVIVSLNKTGEIVFLNESGHKLLGHENGKLIGENWFDQCIPNANVKEIKKKFKAVMLDKTEELYTSENTVVCKNGELKKIQWHNTIIKNENGEVTGTLSFGKDITDWIDVQDQVEKQTKMQEILIELASQFINIPVNEVSDRINMSLSNMGSFINADRAYIFDYDWEKDITINTYEWCAEGIDPEIDNLQEVPLSAIPQWAETHKRGDKMLIYDTSTLTEKDAGLKEILLAQGIKSILTIPLMSGESCIGFVGFDSVRECRAYTKKEENLLLVFSKMLVNITERKKVEADLTKALEKAQESDRLKSAFLANMSHEIRTPMSGIIGFTNLLKKPRLNGDKQKKYIEIIEKSGKRMLNTLNDIIDISRIEAGQVEVVKTVFCVNEILEELYIFFHQEAKEKELTLNYSCTMSDIDATIISDQHKLEGILTNLIKNAIKYTKKGEVTFGYHLVTKNSNQFLEFYVKDSGIGIPKDRIDAIFNRFEQADIEDKMALEGSGLGLSISKSYAEMLEGDISVTSQVGVGSIFSFILPYIKEKTFANSADQNIESDDFFKSLFVIIAEDDDTNILVFKEILNDCFRKVLYAKNGEETIALCKENKDVDLILMDIKMPLINGYEATREIRKFNEEVVIIAQTAYGLAGDREQALAAGCNDYFSKPIIKEDLLSVIKKHF